MLQRAMPEGPSRALLAAIERMRTRMWLVGYRMTGNRDDADDLTQDALARAIERGRSLVHEEGLDGWLLRIATTVALDHLRRRRVERRLTELVDPLDLPELAPHDAGPTPEAATILHEDVRLAVVVALQHVPLRQRAALILHDICDCPLREVAGLLGINVDATKALLGRARSTVAQLRHRTRLDVVADPDVVEQMADAIGRRSIAALTALLADDVWGVVDAGMAEPRRKPTYGARAVSRQWANADRRLADVRLTATIRQLNGEPAVIVGVEGTDALVACIHIETWQSRIAALRVLRDPARLGRLGKDT